MQHKIDTIQTTRKYFLTTIADLTTAALNHIPTGFNNNIIWNLAHLIATQQSICYLRSGLKLTVDEKYFLPYKSGTKPENYVQASEIETIKELFITTLDQFKADYEAGIFIGYDPVLTRYGIEFDNIDTVINFLPYHEGIHCGYINALKKMVTIV